MEEVQNEEDTPWKNEELRKLEEALPRLKECDLEKSRGYKAKTGAGCDGFHPKVPLHLTKETKRRNCGVLGEGGEWKMAEQKRTKER